MNKITPGPLTSFVLSTPDEIDPRFYEQKNNPLEQPEDVKRFAVFDFTTGSVTIKKKPDEKIDVFGFVLGN